MASDDFQLLSKISDKFSSLFVRQNDLNLEILIKKNLAPSKFDNLHNYLFNKCKYFKENDDNFYVKMFNNSERFLLKNEDNTHRVKNKILLFR